MAKAIRSIRRSNGPDPLSTTPDPKLKLSSIFGRWSAFDVKHLASIEAAGSFPFGFTRLQRIAVTVDSKLAAASQGGLGGSFLARAMRPWLRNLRSAAQGPAQMERLIPRWNAFWPGQASGRQNVSSNPCSPAWKRHKSSIRKRLTASWKRIVPTGISFEPSTLLRYFGASEVAASRVRRSGCEGVSECGIRDHGFKRARRG